MGERVVVIGHGAREHALAYKLSYGSADSSRRVRDVMVMGGNAGLAQEFECLTPKTAAIHDVVDLCKKVGPDLIVIGPENYLAVGLKDRLQEINLATFGPTKAATQLEASKYFAKVICHEAQIATAKSERINDFASALRFVDHHPQEKMVIKADGLCAGKGVSVCESKQHAINILNELYLHDGFLRLGTSDTTIIIEDYLPGAEVSVFGLACGTQVALFSPMQDYKRLFDENKGPNTGGMGACGPLGASEHERKQFLERTKEEIFLPALKAMNRRGQPFSGLLYAGLMLVDQQIYLLEFNVRFGDPETQALLFGTKTDIFPLLNDIARASPIDTDFWQKQLLEMMPTITVVLASTDYPFKQSMHQSRLILPTDIPIDAKLFCASIDSDDDKKLFARSGRVLSVTARAPTVAGARTLGYETVRKIECTLMHYRQDIGTHITELN
jgi:phosphoribosylamine--glycine ligase